MGLILHSFVLVPYHSWRISHAKHHAATGHMTRDEVFVPATKSEKMKKTGPAGTGRKRLIDGEMLDELLEDAPLYRLYGLVVQQVRVLVHVLSATRVLISLTAALWMARVPVQQRVWPGLVPQGNQPCVARA